MLSLSLSIHFSPLLFPRFSTKFTDIEHVEKRNMLTTVEDLIQQIEEEKTKFQQLDQFLNEKILSSSPPPLSLSSQIDVVMADDSNSQQEREEEKDNEDIHQNEEKSDEKKEFIQSLLVRGATKRKLLEDIFLEIEDEKRKYQKLSSYLEHKL
jgi:hypothetical protein